MLTEATIEIVRWSPEHTEKVDAYNLPTAQTPRDDLAPRAAKVASEFKAAERYDADAPQKLKEARSRAYGSMCIIMGDKLLVIKLPWSVVRSTSESILAEFVLRHMMEVPDDT